MPWQPSAIVFPDIETVLPELLRDLLTPERLQAVVGSQPNVYVGRNVPEQRLPWMVTCTRDGGNLTELRDQPRVRCLVWAPTDAEANDLAALVVAVAPLTATSDPIENASHLSGPYEIPAESSQPCRYLLFQFTTRGAAL